MTVNTLASKTVALGDGAETEFEFSFIGVNANYINVIYTDADGVETELSSDDYDIVLNAAVSGALWGIGGAVTYDISGSPIPAGSSLTIYRNLPLLQAITLQNQASYGQYGQSTEQAIDLLEMQLQQVSELFQRAIVAPIVDPNALLPLPSAALRANLALVFDADGNPIAGSIPESGIISSSMQPVVGAASLSAGRTAFGLGELAELGVGGGLLSDGEFATVTFATTALATDQTLTGDDQLKKFICTGPININLPRANTLWNGFGFWVFGLADTTTVIPDANDNFPGVASGTGIKVPQGLWVYITTNAASSGVWYAEYGTAVARTNVNPQDGFNMPSNLQLTASVASNILTVALKGNDGNDPSATNPVLVPFRNSDLTSGQPSLLAITAALSINTQAIGATLGSSNSTAFRFWVVLFNNGGSPVLGLVNCSSSTQISPLNEALLRSSTAMSSGATTVGTIYTPNGTTITSKPFRIIGYVEYDSGLTTAGSYASAPTTVQLFGPGVKKPGDVLQVVSATNTSTTTGNGVTQTQTATTASITPSSKVSLLRARAAGVLTGVGNWGAAQLSRGSAPTLIGNTAEVNNSARQCASLQAFDKPQTTGAQAYYVYLVGGTSFAGVWNSSSNQTNTASIQLEELMG